MHGYWTLDAETCRGIASLNAETLRCTSLRTLQHAWYLQLDTNMHGYWPLKHAGVLAIGHYNMMFQWPVPMYLPLNTETCLLIIFLNLVLPFIQCNCIFIHIYITVFA